MEQRLEYLRSELRAERISYEEIFELQCLADQGHIDPGDVELLDAAGKEMKEMKEIEPGSIDWNSLEQMLTSRGWEAVNDAITRINEEE